MKLLFRILCLLTLVTGAHIASAQCTTATINWDNLDYLQRNNTNYSAYITTAQFADMVQTQSFTLGTNRLTIATNFTTTNIIGENGTHTGSGSSNGSGDDIEFKGDGTLTFTLAAAVSNLKFSLYDIDYNQKVAVTALNGTTPVNVTLAKVSGTIVIGGTATAPTATADATTAVATTSTDGTVNVSIAGPVTIVHIVLSQTGTKTNGFFSGQEDGSFWLSDISACVSTDFQNNYYQVSKPFTGQPSYVLAASDQNTVYMIDPATGKATSLFTDNAADVREINNIAYDPYNKLLYYNADGVERLTPAQLPSVVKSIKKYDFNTETISTVIADVNSAPYNIPTFQSGLESGGAAFYNGSLYLGVEGYLLTGTRNSTRESTVWRIDFDGTNPVHAAQAYATPVDDGSANIHDWGDFVIKDGVLVDFNSSAPDYSYTHYNLHTQEKVIYKPTITANRPKQAGITWDNKIVWLGDEVGIYDGTNGVTDKKLMANATGSAVTWVSPTGDGGEAFRPKADFGDAPLSYDPDPLAPAVHEVNPNLKLGAAETREWNKSTAPAINADTDDDGLTYVRILNLSNGNYQTDVTVYNNTGANAIVGAWIDFNGNGTFDAAEGITTSLIPSSPASQSVSLYWTGISGYNLPAYSYSYLRIRVTSAANGMTTSNATGYFPDGEVEDYHVIVNITTLALEKIDFNAVKWGEKVKLKWDISNEANVAEYTVLRSADGANWQTLEVVKAKGNKSYATIDPNPLSATSYYRIYVTGHDGKSSYSETKTIYGDVSRLTLNISPNPAVYKASISISSPLNDSKAIICLINNSGFQLFKIPTMLKKGNNTFALPVSQLPNGNYIVVVQQGALREQKKLLIIK